MIMLNIPIVKQTKNFTCGPNALYMVAKFFNVKVNKKRLLSYFNFKKKTIMPEIGIAAVKIGLKPTIIITNYSYFSPELNTLSRSELIDTLEAKARKEKEQFVKKYYNYLIKYLKLGGKVQFKLFSVRDIRKALKKKIPCICLINTASFSKKEIDKRRSHFFVIRGINKKHIFFNGKKIIKKDIADAMFSMYRPVFPNLLLVEQK